MLRASCQTTFPSKEKNFRDEHGDHKKNPNFYKRDDKPIIYKQDKGEREGDKKAMMKGRGRYILLGKDLWKCRW